MENSTSNKGELALPPLAAENSAAERPLTAYGRRELSVRANAAWAFAGNIVYAGSQWCMLVAIARLGTPAMVGQFALSLAVAGPMILFANMQLRNVQASDARGDYQFHDYLALRLLTTFAALVLLTAFVMSTGWRWEMRLMILIVGAAKCIESLSDILYGALQRVQRLDYIAISMVLKGALALIVLASAIYCTGSLIWGTAGLAGAWFAVFCLFDVPTVARELRHSAPPNEKPASRALRLHWDWHRLRSLLWLVLPLGVVSLLNAVDSNVPRYGLNYFLEERDVGIFAALNSLTVVGVLIVNALGQSAFPQLANYYAAGNWLAFDTLIRNLVAGGLAIGCAGIVVAFYAGQIILKLAYGEVYGNHVDSLCWLVAAMGLQASFVFLGTAIQVMRAFRTQLVIHATSVLFSTGLALYFIGAYGFRGAAWAVFGGAMFQTVAYSTTVWLIRKQMKLALGTPNSCSHGC